MADKIQLSVCDHYAGNRKFAEKALRLQNEYEGRFEITFDLEDGANSTAREQLAEDFLELLRSKLNIYNRTGIRLPELSHPEFRKIAGIFLAQNEVSIHHITIPKIKSSTDFNRVKASLSGLLSGKRTSLPPLRVLIECHEVLTDLDTIAGDPAVESLEIGIMDFISSMNGIIPMDECHHLNEFNNPVVQFLKSSVATTAARCGKTATHNVCREYQDVSLMENFCSIAKKSGFGKMWSIHPSQIPVILRVFTPSAEELEEASHILEQAAQNDWGPVSYKNTLHDMASYRYYYHLLQRAVRLGITPPGDPSQIKLSL